MRPSYVADCPQDTPWAQRLVCGTLATTKAEAAATLNYLPDHNNSPEAIAATCRGI